MKKLLLFAGVMFLFASLVIAQTTFSPTAMEITCSAEVNYGFGDELLDIPFTVSGLPGAFWLVINTHGKADGIVDVQNGFLGWHYVNHIDTTVYVSGRYQRETGDVKVTWDGANSDGVKVPEDTYSYYLWGYDDKNLPQKVSDTVREAYVWAANQNFMVTYDEQGMVLEKPIILGEWMFGRSMKADETEYWRRHGTAYKWEIGSNPEDLNNLSTTWMPFYVDREFRSNYTYGGIVPEFTDHDFYYHHCRNDISNTRTIMKWKFIPGGDAEQDMDYMGWDTDSEWEVFPMGTGNWETPSLNTAQDGSDPYMYAISSVMHEPIKEWNPLTCIDRELGELVFDIQQHEYFMPTDNNAVNEANAVVHSIDTRGGDTLNKMLCVSWMSCLQEMIDTTGIFVDEYDEDYVRWQNRNGDYFMDTNSEEGNETPWACISYASGVNRAYLDDNMFGVYNRSGANPITLLTQDGTAVANMAFFGADTGTAGESSNLIDVGSQYDGFYVPRPSGMDSGRMFHLSFDSAGGLIIPGAVEPGVEEEAQIAYAIEQNAPNPFNPTTTIGFTLAEAGDVTIDVYNVAGQKVDTLLSGLVESGSHSVVWDASGFSAGVYFYTVKSGDFSRTMKMTLLK